MGNLFAKCCENDDTPVVNVENNQIVCCMSGDMLDGDSNIDEKTDDDNEIN